MDLTKKIVALVFLGLCISVAVYWRQAVYPFLTLAPGHIEAFTCSVTPHAAGRISETGPQEGDVVQRGSFLFALDRALFAVRKGQLEGERQKLQAQLVSEQERTEKALEAYLLEIGIPDEAHRHLVAMEEAQGRAETVKQALATIQEELNGIELQVANKAYAAPFDGIVLKKVKPAGALAAEGEEIYRLADPQKIWVETTLSETELAKVSLGMKAQVRLLAYPGQVWGGAVSWIGPATLEGQPRVGLRIAIDSPDNRLKPGLSAEVAVQIH